ncbi:hypothetical protein [Myxococcus sp. SDU36]|uniref:hypothetical protein n=1 Tax=Myxococcus sp. SDU36 TaxID=2831967 RepID=UPI0025438AD0|nr:hypothetical protein [Myxococcus sp. SDU36]WIG94900.1 hypothetical protein KGD87_31055 [Myxococcus sp. SDU36]
MKSRLVVMLAGLSLGLLAACGPVESESELVEVGQSEAEVQRYLCGDGFCDTLNGENGDNCPWDCNVLTWCGDGVCNGRETSRTCPEDCGLILTYCGDGICNGNETTNTCPQDCGPLTWCGDGICNGSETTATCDFDCGSLCGDGVCNGLETPRSCRADCGLILACGDGICGPGEDVMTCYVDCCVGPRCLDPNPDPTPWP